ncbi:MAG TPA: hypothetical protein VI076_13395 [Actinopolymorphaceae bacterium]
MNDRRRPTALDMLVRPRLLLGILTALGAGVMAFTAFAHHRGHLPPAMVLLLVVAVVAAMGGAQREFVRGWVFLLSAWALAIVSYGALFG